ncbi:MAG: phosphate butyryltransferase [Veillonellales bacterium]
MKSFQDVLTAARAVPACKIAVAAAEDDHVLAAINAAQQNGIAQAILVGDQEKITAIASRRGIDTGSFTIIDEPNSRAAALKAVELVSAGKAQIVMKGLISTADMMRAGLNKEVGLRVGRNVISHVAVMEIPGFDRLILLTDAAMNVAPDLPQKVQILQNAVKVAHSLRIPCPRVACLAAVEVVNSGMPACVDGAILAKMAERGQIKGCVVDGPLAFDNAVSLEAARHKGINSPVAGQADILLVPELVSGNILYKAATYFAKGAIAGVIAGAKAPIILTSRADSARDKLYSIALAVMAAQGE